MKALIVKTSALGDVVHAFPVASYLRDKGYEVDWIAETPCTPLVERHPAVHTVYPITTRQWRKGRDFSTFRACMRSLRKERYALVFDLQGNTKSALFTALARAHCKVGFDRSSVSEWPNLLVTHQRYAPKGKGVQQRYLSLASQYFGDSVPVPQPVALELSSTEKQQLQTILPLLKGSILVCPCTRWPNKMLPEKTWITFLKKIDRPFFVCWGTEKEKIFAQRLVDAVPTASLLDQFQLPLLQNAMAWVDQVISVDSLALHLAASVGTPTFSLFTASSAKEYAPVGHPAVQGICPYGVCFERRCPRLRTCQTGACRETLTAEILYRQWSNLKEVF